jgi:hypothetical protein
MGDFRLKDPEWGPKGAPFGVLRGKEPVGAFIIYIGKIKKMFKGARKLSLSRKP